MINAVLVFNNNGEPRLTKFYTQIVRLPNPSEEGKSIPLIEVTTRTPKQKRN